MSFLWTPDSDDFTDGPVTGYGYWATSASALTAVPSATQEEFGWQSDDLVTAASMNYLMKASQSTFQAFLESGLFNSAQLSEQYGDGRDGNVTVTGAVSLTRDMYYSTLEISGAGAIDTAGHRVYAQVLDLSLASAGAIKFNGANGSAGSYGGVGGAGGAAVVGTFVSVSGDRGGGSQGSSGPAPSVTAAAQRTTFASFIPYKRRAGDGGRPISDGVWLNYYAATGTYNYTDEVQYLPAVDPWANAWRGKLIGGGVGGGGGGAGGSDGSAGLGNSGSGGGGGASGGLLFIAAKTIVATTATAAGAIQAKGGAGGAGGDGYSSGNGGGGGGGGSGGSGGTVVILCDAVYDGDSVDDETSTGFADVIDVSGGAGGQGGNGFSMPGDGADGGNGGVVLIMQNGLREDDPRRIVYSPSTAYGADGTRQPTNYVPGTSNQVNYPGGAGGIWKVAL